MKNPGAGGVGTGVQCQRSSRFGKTSFLAEEQQGETRPPLALYS